MSKQEEFTLFHTMRESWTFHIWKWHSAVSWRTMLDSVPFCCAHIIHMTCTCKNEHIFWCSTLFFPDPAACEDEMSSIHGCTSSIHGCTPILSFVMVLGAAAFLSVSLSNMFTPDGGGDSGERLAPLSSRLSRPLQPLATHVHSLAIHDADNHECCCLSCFDLDCVELTVCVESEVVTMINVEAKHRDSQSIAKPSEAARLMTFSCCLASFLVWSPMGRCRRGTYK